MKKAIIGFVVGTWALAALVAVGMVAMAAVGTASANHGDDPRQCGYTITVNSGNYNVEVGINENERGYYFEMDDPDVRVTNLASDRYRVHFTAADAGERQTFYAQAHTSGDPDTYSFCEVHGGFFVKGG